MSDPNFPEERARLAELEPTLLPKEEGRYIVLKGRELVGILDTLDEALEAGFDKTGGPDFFVDRLTAHQDVVMVPALLQVAR